MARPHSRTRRGGNAVEFALTLPIYVAILSGVVDFGWYFNQRMVVTMAGRDAARAASLVPLGGNVETEGEAQGNASLQASGLSGTVDCTLAGTSPDQEVSCSVTVPFVPLIGLAPNPNDLLSRITMRMEEQP
ncbi:MAG: pilus assembly protein [Myxococcota bacterium]